MFFCHYSACSLFFLSLFEWMSGGQDLYLMVFNGKLKYETFIEIIPIHFIQKIKPASKA